MFELLLMLALAVVVGLCTLMYALPWDTVLAVGLVLVAVGLLAGAPMGFYYHVLLHRALAPKGELPRRWWLNPVPLNARLSDEDRPTVMRWFYVSATTFGLCVIGCGVVMLAVFRWSRT